MFNVLLLFSYGIISLGSLEYLEIHLLRIPSRLLFKLSFKENDSHFMGEKNLRNQKKIEIIFLLYAFKYEILP